jgi:hypothetical protein
MKFDELKDKLGVPVYPLDTPGLMEFLSKFN